jgi:hypothetical protein
VSLRGLEEEDRKAPVPAFSSLSGYNNMIKVNSSNYRYSCFLKAISFRARVYTNSKLLLNELLRIAPFFQSPSENNKRVGVEYLALKKKRGYILLRDGRPVYETPYHSEFLIFLLDCFLEDFIKSIDGYLLIHAAVLVKNGKAIVLPAKSRSGKSTLSIALIKRGFRYLSDEVAAINLKTLRVRGFPRPIGIRKKTLLLFSSLGPEINYKFFSFPCTKGTVEFHFGIPSRGRTASVTRSFPVSSIIFPVYTPNGTTSIDELGKAQAVFNVMRCSFNQRKLKDKVFKTAVNLVRQTECYVLRTKEISRACEIIGNLI